MKKLLIPCIVGVMMFGIGAPSGAVLVYDDAGAAVDARLVYDDVAERYWYRDLADMTEMTYSEQIEFIAGLNSTKHAGLSNWRMATGDEFDVLWGNGTSSIADAFHPSAVTPLNLPDQPWTMWYVGRCDEVINAGYHVVAFVIDQRPYGTTADLDESLDSDTSFLFSGSVEVPLGAWITASVKTQVDNAMAFKADAIEILKAVSKTGDRQIDYNLYAAIKHIERSLGVGSKHVLWRDEMHIDSRLGRRVFDEEKRAVARLKYLLRSGQNRHSRKYVPQEIQEAAQAAIDMLIEADTLLAMQARADAQAAHDASTGDKARRKISRELDKCVKELEKAIDEGQKGHPRHVIDHLKRAWEHAQRALAV